LAKGVLRGISSVLTLINHLTGTEMNIEDAIGPSMLS
jgi:hypothetical protein